MFICSSLRSTYLSVIISSMLIWWLSFWDSLVLNSTAFTREGFWCHFFVEDSQYFYSVKGVLLLSWLILTLFLGWMGNFTTKDVFVVLRFSQELFVVFPLISCLKIFFANFGDYLTFEASLTERLVCLIWREDSGSLSLGFR